MFISQTVQTLTQNIEGFSKQVFSSTSGFAFTLLGAFASIWFLYVGYNAVVKGDFNLPEVINKVILFSILAAMLSANNSLFYNYAYSPIKDTTNALVKNVLTISPAVNGKKMQSSSDATNELEWTYGELGKLVKEVKDKVGWQEALMMIMALGLVHFCLVMGGVLYSLYGLAFILKLCAVGALSPLLIVAFAFNKTRGHVIGALQYLLCSALTFVISSFFVGLLLFSLRTIMGRLDVGAVTSDDVTIFTHVLLSLSIISIYVLLLAPGMAAAISGARSDTALTGLAAAAVTGGYAYIASKVGFGSLKAAKNLVGPSPRTSAASARTSASSAYTSVTRNNFAQNQTPRRST